MMDTPSEFSHQKRIVSVPKWRYLVFHPLTVLGASLLAALLFALLVIMWFDGSVRSFLLYYFLPIGIPFVAYLFDRAQYSNEYGLVRWGIDLVVVSLSLLRAFGEIPLISGHALFLSFALLTTHSWLTRILALLIMCQVIYLKLFVWRDMTLWGGIVLGRIAAVCFQHAAKMKKQVESIV